MKALLTDQIISQLILNKDRVRLTVSDIVCPGLSLEIRGEGKGSWRYRFSQFGAQKCLSIGLLHEMTLTKAREQCFLVKSQLENGLDASNLLSEYRQKQCPTFNAFVEEFYLPHIRTYKRAVWADETLLNNHLLPSFGRARLNAIKDIQITQFLQEKITRGYKPGYCNRFLVLLGFIFNLAMKWEIPGVTRNPVQNVQRLKNPHQIERFLKEEEAVRLMETIKSSPNPLLKFFVTLALMTGARKRELLDAKWEDFDFGRRVWVIPMTKSGKPRHVPLIDDAIQTLFQLKDFLPTLLIQRSFLDVPYVFPNPKTGKPFNSIFHSWDTARKLAGLEDLRIHDLRHSFASALVNKGVPIYDVQKLLGHQNIRTTERYAHLAPERLRQSASLVSECFDLTLDLAD